MNALSICITHRTGDVERSIQIDCAEPVMPLSAVLESSATDATPTPPAAQQLEWSATLCDGKSVDYAAAEKACAALGDGWHLPTRFELESILDLTRLDPAIDTARFPDTKSTWYWTSTPCAWSPDFAWVVDFDFGSADDLHRYGSACVRAVRSVPAGQ